MAGPWDPTDSLSPDARDLFQRALAAGGRLTSADTGSDAAAEELCDLGLARADADVLHVLPPRQALAGRATDLAGRRDRLLALADDLGTIWERYVDSPSVEVLVGDAAGAAFQSIIAGARVRVEACSINATPTGAELGTAPAHEPAQDRGVEFRALYDVAVMSDPVGVAAVREAVAMGEIARVLPKVPMTYLAADGEVMGVFPPVRTVGPPADAADPPPRPGPGDGRVLRAAVGPGHRGPPDRVGAARARGRHRRRVREVGVSERTLSRRIADLQLRLGAKSRYQLGYQAALRMRQP